MKTKFLILLGLIVSTGAFTQQNKFVVYSFKGNVSIVSNNTESKARIGTLIEGNATIKLGAGSFATLICNETKMFSLKKSGDYTTSSLKDSCTTNSSSVSVNYVKYVWSELTKPHGTPEKNRKHYMSNVGAVSRGINNIWIDPKLDTILFSDGTIPLSWKSYTDAEEFEFSLFGPDNLETPILTLPVKKKHVDLKDILKNMQPGKSYYWSARIKGEENDERKYLVYVPANEYKTFYSSIQNTEAAETEAEKNFRMGFLLEESHYLADAFQHYKKATELDAENPMYRFVFMSFKKDYEIK